MPVDVKTLLNIGNNMDKVADVGYLTADMMYPLDIKSFNADDTRELTNFG